MIKLDKQFSTILEKFKLIENSLNNINNVGSDELIKLNREYSELRPIVEKMITLAKKGSLHARRQLISKLPRDANINKLFNEFPERYKNRAGGYVRILKKGIRFGDAAPMAVIELVDRNVEEKNQDVPKKSQNKETNNLKNTESVSTK